METLPIVLPEQYTIRKPGEAYDFTPLREWLSRCAACKGVADLDPTPDEPSLHVLGHQHAAPGLGGCGQHDRIPQ
jgi:hypothetical protein